MNEKSQKTNANQNTKFHQLQRMFGKQTGDAEPVPLYKQINQGDVFSTEHEVRSVQHLKNVSNTLYILLTLYEL